MSTLKPYKSNSVKIPAQIEIDINGTIDVITYPIYGTMSEKLTYINLMNGLNIMAECDESQIR